MIENSHRQSSLEFFHMMNSEDKYNTYNEFQYDNHLIIDRETANPSDATNIISTNFDLQLYNFHLFMDKIC